MEPNFSSQNLQSEEDKKYNLRKKPAISTKFEDLQFEEMLQSKKYSKLGMKIQKTLNRGLISDTLMFRKSKQELRQTVNKILSVTQQKQGAIKSILLDNQDF